MLSSLCTGFLPATVPKMRAMLRTLTAGAFLMLGAMADEPTKGRTDGEPGNGEHCCGMKGLGGATVTVLCHPDTIALGQEFTVNVAYTTDIKRPVDVHVDLLNAQNKAVRPSPPHPPFPFPRTAEKVLLV